MDPSSESEPARISSTEDETVWKRHPEARFSAGDRVQLASVVRCMPMDLVRHEDEEGAITGVRLEPNEAMEHSYHVVFGQEDDAQDESGYWIKADNLEAVNE